MMTSKTGCYQRFRGRRLIQLQKDAAASFEQKRTPWTLVRE
jgi:hypothetical protein